MKRNFLFLVFTFFKVETTLFCLLRDCDRTELGIVKTEDKLRKSDNADLAAIANRLFNRKNLSVVSCQVDGDRIIRVDLIAN